MTYLTRNRKSYRDIERENKRRFFYSALTDISVVILAVCFFFWFYSLAISL